MSLGLYLHVPFCTRRCDYCDFYVVVGRDGDLERFVAAMESAIRARAARLDEDERIADTIYIGGGTPSRLDPRQVARLIAACRDAFDVAADAEVTLEANPEGIDAARLAGWLDAGVNRLSVGVQTLSDEGLRRRGRLHTGEGALASLRAARAAGFANVSADLIAGLPATSREGGFAGTFAGEARRVLAERPDHLSVYLFEADKETPLRRAVLDGRETLPDDDAVAEAFTRTIADARAAGYERYEIASFARPLRRSRHNLKYWTGEPYVGFGPGAHSHLRGRRFSAPRDLDLFLAREGASGSAGAAPPAGDADYTLRDPEAAAREALVLNLRLMEGVDLDAFDRARGLRLKPRVLADLADPLAAALVVLEGARLRLTDRGALLANEVFSRIQADS